MDMQIWPVLEFWHSRKQWLKWDGLTAYKWPLSNILGMAKLAPSNHRMRFAIFHAYCLLSLLACRTQYRSSVTVVNSGKQLLNHRKPVPVVWNVLQALYAMLCAIPNTSARLVIHWPLSNFPIFLFRIKSSISQDCVLDISHLRWNSTSFKTSYTVQSFHRISERLLQSCFIRL